MLSNTIFPYLNKLKTSSSVKFDLEFIKINRYFTLISMLIIVLVIIFSRWIVKLLFGDDFIESSNILNIHIIGLLFVFFGVIGSKWILINNFQQITMYKTLIGMVVNLILNFLFIPAFGIIGCACATVISQIFSGYILNLISYKTRELFILQSKALIPFYGKK
jgi:polysaccharide transporter, PST family